MWPFKNKIPYVTDVIFENEGQTITIFHENGAHKFNKEEVLDSYLSIDEYSAPKLKWFPSDEKFLSIHQVYALSLFGGWWSMIYSLFPSVAIFIPYNSKVETSLYTENNDFLLYAVFWFILPLILTLISLYVTAILIRFLAVKYDEEYKSKYENIIEICLNHETIKFRFNQEKIDGRAKYKRPEDWLSILSKLDFYKNRKRVAETSSDLLDNLFNDPTKKELILFGYIPLIAILLFFNWDKPFLFWQILETKLSEMSWFNSFVTDHKETFQYYKYYAQYEINDQFLPQLQYNTNPIMAFFDGMLGTVCFLLVGISLIPIAAYLVCAMFVACSWAILLIFILFPLITNKINKKSYYEWFGNNIPAIAFGGSLFIFLLLFIIEICGFKSTPIFHVNMLIGLSIVSLITVLMVWIFFRIIYKYFKGEKIEHYDPHKQDDPQDPNNRILIRHQFWMKKDLTISEFRNGDSIFQAKTQEEWKQAFVEQKPAWCYYNFEDLSNYYARPKLYNSHAISDPRGLAPEGFKIPSKEDWKTLWNVHSPFFSYRESEGVRPELIRNLKSNSGWNLWQINKIVCDYHSHNRVRAAENCDNCQSNGKLINEFYSGNGNNELGFNAHPEGIISNKGESIYKGERVYYWTLLDKKNDNDLCVIIIDNKNTPIKVGKVTNLYYGFSVRCILEE